MGWVSVPEAQVRRAPCEAFVTISEAAHELGVSERTVQRRVAKLVGADRQTTDTGRVLVRREALGLTDKSAAVEEKPDRQGLDE